MRKREPERSPVVCGAIGSYDPQAVARIASLSGAELFVAHDDPQAIVHLDREASRWEGADGAWGVTWHESVPPPAAPPGDWRAAARGGACGLFAEGARRGVHASGSGVAPLYWMRAGRALYFASTVDALARSGLVPVSPDWEAWAAILSVSYPLEGRTPFAEIGRFGPVAAARAVDGGIELIPGELEWADQPPESVDAAAERIVAALRAEAARLEPAGPIACPLTGGWDSRLIACALAERGLIDTAYTVNTDRGDTLDEDIAAEVAGLLGVPHVVVAPETPPFAAELRAAAHRLEHQSMLHLQMFRLEAGLPAGGVLADGVGGNFLKGFLLTPEVLAERSAAAAAARLYEDTTPARMALVWRDDAWQALRSPSRVAFLREAERFEGHRSGPSLALYCTRTLRGIAVSPGCILAPHHALFMPLVSDGVVSGAMAVDPGEKLDGRLYRRVLREIDPKIGALPSTNDGLERAVSRRPLQRTREARDAHLDLLERSPLRPWFSPRLEDMVARRVLARVDKSPRRVVRVQMIASFGLWCERYRDLIGEPDTAPLFAG